MSDAFIPWIPGGPPAPGDEFYGVDRSPTTAAKGWPEPTAEGLKAALKAIEALGVHRPPRIDFYHAPERGPGAVAALVDGEPAGWMSGERFAEFNRRLAEEGLNG